MALIFKYYLLNVSKSRVLYPFYVLACFVGNVGSTPLCVAKLSTTLFSEGGV